MRLSRTQPARPAPGQLQRPPVALGDATKHDGIDAPGKMAHIHCSSTRGPRSGFSSANVTRLGVDLGAVEVVMLSHGHWDHAGALPRALQLISQRRLRSTLGPGP